MRRHVLIIYLLLLIGPWTAHAAEGVREVQYDERGVVPINAKLRVTTTIVLPTDEAIVDFICGDKDFWVINGNHNVAHVKPAKERAWTNLNLVTTSGRIYTFRLQEGATEPDFKVFVTVPGNLNVGTKRFYTREEVDALRTQVADAQAAAEAATNGAREAIEAHRADYPARLRFDYTFDRGKKPFEVAAIWHDGASTFIRTSARELPALYEEKDGQPSLVNYQVHEGTYVVTKVLDRGYLMLGKEKLAFRLANQ